MRRCPLKSTVAQDFTDSNCACLACDGNPKLSTANFHACCSEASAEDGTGKPSGASRREEARRSHKDTSVQFDPTKHSLVVEEDDKPPTTSRRRSSSDSRRRSNGNDGADVVGGSRTPRKKSVDAEDAAADRPSMKSIFNDSDNDDDDSTSDIFDVRAETASPSPRRDSGRRRSSHAADLPGARQSSPESRSQERPLRRKSTSRDRRRPSSREKRKSSIQEDSSPPRRGRRPGSTGPPSLSQTMHAARSLSAIGAGGSGSRRPKTRAELKEQGRLREWASFCRRKTYLSLEDLSREEMPRVARKGAVTPFSLQLTKVNSKCTIRCSNIGSAAG